MKQAFQAVLLVLIVALSWLIIDGINKPIRFNEERDARYEVVVTKLKKIRDAQLAYKVSQGKFASDWDSLTMIIKNDSFPMVVKKGDVPEHLNEKQALDSGYITRDTVPFSMYDSLFHSFDLATLRNIPFSEDSVFSLEVTILETGSGMKVPAFEVKAPNKTILIGMDNQERINLDADAVMLEKYPGLKVGSLEEASTAGNWETL